MKIINRKKFLFGNLLKGLAWFIAIVLIFLLAKEYLPYDPEGWVGNIYDRPVLVYLVFTLSEIVVGIIPPEVFMIWSLQSANPFFSKKLTASQ